MGKLDVVGMPPRVNPNSHRAWHLSFVDKSNAPQMKGGKLKGYAVPGKAPLAPSDSRGTEGLRPDACSPSRAGVPRNHSTDFETSSKAKK
jgi:hypothetical protein